MQSQTDHVFKDKRQNTVDVQYITGADYDKVKVKLSLYFNLAPCP